MGNTISKETIIKTGVKKGVNMKTKVERRAFTMKRLLVLATRQRAGTSPDGLG